MRIGYPYSALDAIDLNALAAKFSKPVWQIRSYLRDEVRRRTVEAAKVVRAADAILVLPHMKFRLARAKRLEVERLRFREAQTLKGNTGTCDQDSGPELDEDDPDDVRSRTYEHSRSLAGST